jgi:hypothetical protein
MTCSVRFSAVFVSASNAVVRCGNEGPRLLGMSGIPSDCQTLMIGPAKKSLFDKRQTSSHLGTTKAEIAYDF